MPKLIYKLGIPKLMTKTCTASCDSCRGCPIGAEIVESVPSAGGIPLAAMGNGGCGKIVRVAGKTEQRRYLSDLGLVAGTDVSVVNTVSGNLLLEVKGTRIAMDRSMASKIFIIPGVC